MKKIFNSQFQMMHLDRANKQSMRTTTININSNLAVGTNHLVHQFKHGYTYPPQLWGLWDITYNSFFGSGRQRGYGDLISTSGFAPTIQVSYAVVGDWVNIYFNPTNPTGVSGYTVAGTKLVITTYVFANDYAAQDYIS